MRLVKPSGDFLVPVVSSVQCAIADWTAYVGKAALMQKRGQIDVVTISQYYDGFSIPRVSP